MIYHKSLGFPSSLVIPDLLVNLHYSKHAQERMQREVFQGSVKVLPMIVRVNAENIFEIETMDNIESKKVSLRMKYDDRKDLVLILDIMSDSKAIVVTFWFNNKTDTHRKLNLDKYTKLIQE